MAGSHLSKEFFELVKAIGESKSKQVTCACLAHTARAATACARPRVADRRVVFSVRRGAEAVVPSSCAVRFADCVAAADAGGGASDVDCRRRTASSCMRSTS
jgi:hypothetical protein